MTNQHSFSGFTEAAIAEEQIEKFVDFKDRELEVELSLRGYNSDEAHRLRNLWSLNNACGTSVDLRLKLESKGVIAETIINDDAFLYHVALPKTVPDLWAVKSHIIVRANIGGQTLYIDPFWQQFIGEHGLTMRDVKNNPERSLVSGDRVLCYQADQLNDVCGLFAQVVRRVHDNTRRGIIKSDMFTRVVTAEAITNSHYEPAPVASYLPIEELEIIARGIWDPQLYRPISDEEIESFE